eukprot:3784215-Prymnesium_polylepis.1
MVELADVRARARVRDRPREVLMEQRDVELVVKLERVERPRPVEARVLRVAAAERVRPRERDNLPVVEAHAVEDEAQMVGRPVSARQVAVGRRVPVTGRVDATHAVRDPWSAHQLDGHDCRQLPQ